MLNKLLIVLFLIFDFQLVSSQNTDKIKTNEYRFGIGSVGFRNFLYIPSGLPGENYNFTYINKKESQRKLFEFFAKANYSYLMNKEISNINNQYYNYFDIKFGTIWSREIPAPLSNFKWNVGFGESFNAFFCKTPIENLNPFGNWRFTSDLKWEMKYNLKQITFQTQITIPLLVFGHFDHYQNSILKYHFDDYLASYITPNTFTTINKYFDINSDISILYHFKMNKKLSLKCNYEFGRLKSNVFGNLILRQLQMFSVGIIIKK